MIFLDVLATSLSEEFGDKDWSESRERYHPHITITSNTCLWFRVKLSEGERVTISTGERLRDLEGFVHLRSQPSESQVDQLDIGTMRHSDEVPDHEILASYHIEVSIPEGQLQNLIAAARHGRIPSSIIVTARGMLRPDEFSNVWDVKSSPCLRVLAIRATMPLTVAVEGEEPSSSFPPTQTQIRHLFDDIAALREVTKDIAVKMKWLIALMVFGGAVFLLRL